MHDKKIIMKVVCQCSPFYKQWNEQIQNGMVQIQNRMVYLIVRGECYLERIKK